MRFGTRAKQIANSLLAGANVRIDSCTAERREAARLRKLADGGHFEGAVVPVLSQFEACDPSQLLADVHKRENEFTEATQGSYSIKNSFFTTPDAEILFSMVHIFRPGKVIEVGSGNSTRLFRAALNSAKLDCVLTSIDPEPRVDITEFSDRTVRKPVESVSPTLFSELAANDFLFIDSSHEIHVGNDVVSLMLGILPRLSPGVIIHIHDIFLPYEYPRDWIVREQRSWTEQYLVQALLCENNSMAVLWPGQYLQRTMPNFQEHFRHWHADSNAGSLWLQRR